MKEITVQELKAMKDSKQDFQLIDVREDYEYELTQLGGELLPFGDVLDNVEKISKDKQVVFYCRSGARSAAIITELENEHGFTNLYNLKGGIVQYAKEIDPSMTKFLIGY